MNVAALDYHLTTKCWIHYSPFNQYNSVELRPKIIVMMILMVIIMVARVRMLAKILHES